MAFLWLWCFDEHTGQPTTTSAPDAKLCSSYAGNGIKEGFFRITAHMKKRIMATRGKNITLSDHEREESSLNTQPLETYA